MNQTSLSTKEKMIVPFIDSKDVYRLGFEQNGYEMPRYRGSLMIGGSF